MCLLVLGEGRSLEEKGPLRMFCRAMKREGDIEGDVEELGSCRSGVVLLPLEISGVWLCWWRGDCVVTV